MIRKATLALVAVVAITSSAFAQSFDPEMGTGNVAVVFNATTAPQQGKAVTGLYDYAMVPSQDPAPTGTGSIGYEELLKAQW